MADFRHDEPFKSAGEPFLQQSRIFLALHSGTAAADGTWRFLELEALFAPIAAAALDMVHAAQVKLHGAENEREAGADDGKDGQRRQMILSLPQHTSPRRRWGGSH